MTRYAETRTAWLPAEKQLAQDVPFGSAAYLRERAAVTYRRRLELLGEHLPAAVQFAEALDAWGGDVNRLFADAVVRGAIDDLLRVFRFAGERELAEDQFEFFTYYSTHLDELKRDAADTADGFRQELLGRPIRYWSNASARTLRDRAFFSMLQQHLPRPPVYFAEAETEAAISQGLALLQELLPMAGKSAVSHLYFIIVDEFYEDSIGSATISPILGTIFLARKILRSPWTIAEAILHECMHLKFVEIEHTHSLLPPGYSEQTSPLIHPPWHAGAEAWPMNRTLTAAHVYVTLALYSLASETAAPELEARYGPCERSVLLQDPSAAAGRARSLIDRASRHPESLGKAGRAFLEWMGDVLQKLPAGPAVLREAV